MGKRFVGSQKVTQMINFGGFRLALHRVGAERRTYLL